MKREPGAGQPAFAKRCWSVIAVAVLIALSSWLAIQNDPLARERALISKIEEQLGRFNEEASPTLLAQALANLGKLNEGTLPKPLADQTVELRQRMDDEARKLIEAALTDLVYEPLKEGASDRQRAVTELLQALEERLATKPWQGDFERSIASAKGDLELVSAARKIGAYLVAAERSVREKAYENTRGSNSPGPLTLAELSLKAFVTDYGRKQALVKPLSTRIRDIGTTCDLKNALLRERFSALEKSVLEAAGKKEKEAAIAALRTFFDSELPAGNPTLKKAATTLLSQR